MTRKPSNRLGRVTSKNWPWPGADRPLSVKEAAALIGISGQRLAHFIRRGDLPASTLNGRDYVLDRKSVLLFNERRRHGPGHPSFAELRMREETQRLNEHRISFLRKRRAQVLALEATEEQSKATQA